MAEQQGIRPRNCGIRLNPPSLVLFYEDAVSGTIHKRVMPLRGFSVTSDIQTTITLLKEKNALQLSGVPAVRLEKLLAILQEVLCGSTLPDAVAKINNQFRVDPEEDLNKLDKIALERKKSVMNDTFEANQIKPEDPDFQYDVVVNFEPDAIESSGWDSDMEDRIL